MEDEELLKRLNQDFTNIRDLLVLREPEPQPNLIINDSDPNYDKFVVDLAADKRSRPTDRLKTQMELAREEKARLEILEVGLFD